MNDVVRQNTVYLLISGIKHTVDSTSLSVVGQINTIFPALTF